MNGDLKIIKKKYGEKMAHLCRNLFPSILETEGKLSGIMLKIFDENHDLYEDILNNELVVPFKNYIYSLLDIKLESINTSKTACELLDMAGYTLFKCLTEQDIQKFKKYYYKSEKLCTFRGGRLKTNYVFFAIKKDVDEIKRSDFKNPKRQDRYGTSVISIQFTKDSNHTLSIKNRYNHSVQNPDATFSNNLDNIIPGLTNAFERDYGLKQKHINKTTFEIPNYICIEGKHYKYNYEISNTYYCPNNVVIENFMVKKYDKEKYILFDYFILDLVNKDFVDSYIKDSFFDTIKNIKKIKIENNKEGKNIIITTDLKEDIIITLNKQNKIIGYKNNNVTEIYINFLYYNDSIKDLELNKVKKISSNFLRYNNSLLKLSLPKVKEIANDFLRANLHLKELNLPSLKIVSWGFLSYNCTLEKLSLPNLERIGSYFLKSNGKLKEIYLPKAKKVSSYFLKYNNSLTSLILPEVVKIDEGFMMHNESLLLLYTPNLETTWHSFLKDNKNLKYFYAPKLKSLGVNCLEKNKKIKKQIVKQLKK